MERHNFFSKERESDRNKGRIHPVWRGVGFVLMIFIPILSYLASGLILEYNQTEHWFPIPPEFIINWQDPLILMKLFITVMLSFIAFAVFQLITFLLFGLFGPKRYIPPDLPPLKRRR